MNIVEDHEKKQRANIFFKNHIQVHIQTSKWFYNGIITKLTDDFLILQDRKRGPTPILFLDITKIEPF